MCAGKGSGQEAEWGQGGKAGAGAQQVSLAVRVPWIAENNLKAVQRADQLLQFGRVEEKWGR